MEKLQRNYYILLNDKKMGTVKIQPPFTLEFDVITNPYAQVSGCTLRVYNLNQDTRNRLMKDWMDLRMFRMMEFYAGYGQDMPMLFRGNISKCSSQRIGTDFITTIEGFDGQFARLNGYTNRSYKKGVAIKQIITEICGDLKEPDSNGDLQPLRISAIGNFPGNLKKDATYQGRTYQILMELSNGHFYIDKGAINITQDTESQKADIVTLNAESGGLLGTPMREEGLLTAELIFEPRLILGQLINLESKTATYFNGVCKVISMAHKGTISDSICGTATSTVKFWFGLDKVNTII